MKEILIYFMIVVVICMFAWYLSGKNTTKKNKSAAFRG